MSWLRRLGPARAGGWRLIAVPYAGAGAGAYAAWAAHLPADGELHAVVLPGRDARVGEAPLSELAAVVAGLVPALAALADRPLVLYGHSVGALIAAACARDLAARGMPPRACLVAACRAAHLPPRLPPLTGLDDRGLWRAMGDRYGGTPGMATVPDELIALLSSALRADAAIADQARIAPAPPLPCPLLACGADDDPAVTLDDLAAWRAHAGAGFALHQFTGGHFFLHAHAARLVALAAAT